MTSFNNITAKTFGEIGEIQKQLPPALRCNIRLERNLDPDPSISSDGTILEYEADHIEP